MLPLLLLPPLLQLLLLLVSVLVHCSVQWARDPYHRCPQWWWCELSCSLLVPASGGGVARVVAAVLSASGGGAGRVVCGLVAFECDEDFSGSEHRGVAEVVVLVGVFFLVLGFRKDRQRVSAEPERVMAQWMCRGVSSGGRAWS